MASYAGTTELLALYQQRAVELARLRKAAVEEAHGELGMTYTEVASAIGVSKGRVTQLRGAAPGPERILFGVGPVAIGIPLRHGATDRERLLIAAEDAKTGDLIEHLLRSLAFVTTRAQIEPERTEPLSGDAVMVCGPKSAPVAAQLLDQDPVFTFVEDAGRWWIENRRDGRLHGSPTDDEPPRGTDVAYVARHRDEDRVLVHVAGLHGIGSLGAATYLTDNLADLFEGHGDMAGSFLIETDYHGLDITAARLVDGPHRW